MVERFVRTAHLSARIGSPAVTFIEIGVASAQTIAAVVGLYLTVMNWGSLARGRSWTPLLGGGLLALVALSVPRFRPLFWLPFLLDFGSFPGLSWTLVAWVIRMRRHEPRDKE